MRGVGLTRGVGESAGGGETTVFAVGLGTGVGARVAALKLEPRLKFESKPLLKLLLKFAVELKLKFESKPMFAFALKFWFGMLTLML